MLKKKGWLRAAKIVAFLLLAALLVYGLNNLIAPSNLVARKIDVYLQAENPEVAVMGNSTVMRLLPELMDETSGMDVYQFGSQIQTLTASRYLLQELIDQGKKPKVLLLYMHIRRLQKESGDYDATFVQGLPWGRNKLGMLTTAFTLDELPEALLPSVYGREALWDNIGALFATGEKEKEDPVVPEWMAEEYAIAKEALGKASNSIFVNAHDPASIDIGVYDTFKVEKISQQSLAQFHEIVALCREHDIQLVTFSLPILPGNPGWRDHFGLV